MKGRREAGNLYDGEIAYVDQELGRFFNWLGEQGLYDPSLIIFTSDHGEAFYEHEHWQHSDTLYQEMIRVPLLVKWPHGSARNNVETPVSHVDLFSTILEAAGLPSTGTEGSSFSRYRKSSSPADGKPTVSEVIWWADDPVVKKISLRSRNLKYIATFEASADDDLTIDKIKKEELYDLAVDPGEKNSMQTPRHMEAYVDQELGRFFNWLGEQGLYDPSLIIFTSDHGEAFYEHEHWQHSVSKAASGPSRKCPGVPGRSRRGRSGRDRRRRAGATAGAGIRSMTRLAMTRLAMTRLAAWLFLLSCVFSGCAPPPPSPPGPVFFARQVDQAEKDYDHKLFISYRKDGLLSAPVTLGKETQLSLTPPLPSRLTFTVPVPAEPLLKFSIGVSTLGEETFSNPVHFAIYVDEEIRFEETARRSQPNVWLQRTVDLSEWSGKTVRLGFETIVRGRSPEGAGSAFLPAWGNPVLGGSLTDMSDRDGMNLVLISIDCLRADHVSAYGYERKTTPNIDRFAADGVLFRNAASVSSWTLPTHMSMMTGLMPSLHGASRAYKLSSSVPYLPEILAESGYQTLGVASGGYVSQAWGFERGFDVYRMLTDRRASEIVDAALELVQRSRTPRQFLFVHLFDAHWPYLPPREFLDRFDERPPDISDIMPKVIFRKPPTGPEEIQHFVNLYDGEIAYLDQELGRFFTGLKQAGLYDRSMIVLTVDHGESFYEHDVWQHSESLFEEVTHIPLIVKWPRNSITGDVESLVSQLNIFPTMLEQAGLVPPYDYVPLGRFLGESSTPPMNALGEITWDAKEGQGAAMKTAVKNGRLKYILTLAGEIGDELFVSEVVNEELYDLAKDPGEQKNLLPDGASDIGALRRDARRLLEKARALQANRGGDEVILDEELTEHLKALGYIN